MKKLIPFFFAGAFFGIVCTKAEPIIDIQRVVAERIGRDAGLWRLAA